MDLLVGVGTGLYAQLTQAAHPSMPVLGRHGSRETLELAPYAQASSPTQPAALVAYSSGQTQMAAFKEETG